MSAPRPRSPSSAPWGQRSPRSFAVVNGTATFSNATADTTVTDYDGVGNTVAITALGNLVTTYFYDGDHNLTETVDPIGMITSLTYDKLGRRSSVTVPGVTANDLLTTTTTYLTAQDKVITTYPDTTTSMVEFDDLGRTVASTNENSETISYGYYQESRHLLDDHPH